MNGSDDWSHTHAIPDGRWSWQLRHHSSANDHKDLNRRHRCLYFYLTSVKFCKLLHQVESNYRFHRQADFRAVHLIETLEDVLLLLIADSLPLSATANA